MAASRGYIAGIATCSLRRRSANGYGHIGHGRLEFRQSNSAAHVGETRSTQFVLVGNLMKNWDLARLATVAGIGASVGVMISVVYLAIQIQGSNEQLRAQFYSDTLDISLTLRARHKPRTGFLISQENLSNATPWRRSSSRPVRHSGVWAQAHFCRLPAEG